MNFVGRIGIVSVFDGQIDIKDARPGLGVLGQQRRDHVDEVPSEMAFDGFGILIDDEIGQCLDSGLLEGVLQSGKKVEDAAESPDVDWVGVQLVLDDLRSEVDRSADSLRNELGWVLNDLAHAKIPYFDLPLLGHEDVLEFDVPVDDPHFMQVLDGVGEGHKDVPEFLLRKWFFLGPAFPDDLSRRKGTLA